MKALFLVGGSGTRLRPLTNHLPKPMMPIMGRPLLERNCLRLRECGVRDIVLSACYQPQKIMQHFKNGEPFGLHLHYVLEKEPLGTGGAIKNSESFFDDTFFIFNADILCDISLEEMLRFHKKMGAEVTIAATFVKDPTAYGVIEYDERDYVVKFTEKPKAKEINSHYINAGIYIFEPQVLEHIPAGVPLSVEREIFPSILYRGGKIAVFKDSGYWMDIGTPQKYVQAHRDIFAGRCKISESDFEEESEYIDKTAKLHPTVVMQCPVFVGKNAVLGKGCIVGPNVSIGENAVIGEDCYLVDSIVWPNTTVPAGSNIRSSIVAQVEDERFCLPYEGRPVYRERERRYAGNELH